MRTRIKQSRGISGPLVVALIASLSVSTPAQAVPSSFITRQGTELLLDGNPFRFTGLNIFNVNSDGWCTGFQYTESTLDQSFTDMGSGKEVMRGWFFQSLATTVDGQRDWTRFDRTLQVAGEHDVRVIVTLTDQNGECGDLQSGQATGPKDRAWYEDGYRTEIRPDALVPYRDWVVEVVTRYRDDPRVAFWQLINEAEVSTFVDGEKEACPQGTDEPAEILRAWAQDVGGLVKSIDPNHLVSLGTIGSGQCGAQGDQYQFVHDIPEIDLCEFHDYGAPTVGLPGDQFNGLQRRLEQCEAIDKPLFVGEAGIKPTELDGSLQARADAFRSKMTVQFSAGVAGFLAWNWSALGSTTDDFDIGPGDPALEALSDPPLIVQIATGGQHTCALTTDGAVWCWGGNDHGELGDGTQADRLNPVPVSGLASDVRAITAGANHACAITGTGGVVCWGFNAFGQLGDGTHETRLVPTPVPGLSTGVEAIAAGSYHTCALLDAGGVQCWGIANRGQLGYGDTTPPWFTAIESPTPVDGLSSGVGELTAGYNHTCALLDAGDAKCWGANDFGQLGDGTTADRNSPADVVVVPAGVTAITVGEQHTCALVNGGAMCWGRNTEGQLGDGTTASRTTAAAVTGLTSSVTAIEAGVQYTCAVTDAGGAKCWGRNEAGQLGDGTKTQRLEPVDVSGLSSAVEAIGAATFHTCAIVGSGNVNCWGLNFFGELGDGTTIERDAPVDVVWLPPEAVPDDPTSLGQFEANGTTAIALGSTTDGTTVVLKATVSDPEAGLIRLQVEVEAIGTPFDGNGLITSASVSSGSVASVQVAGLARARGYHWRARALDESDAPSQNWVSFGANSETAPDFVVEAPIAFSSTRHGSNNANQQEIYAMAPDGSNAVRLTTNTTTDTDPSLSPDGTKIAFQSNRDGDYEIFVMNVDGTNIVQLTTNTATDQAPAWSPDGTKVAFASNRVSQGNYDVWSMNADGTNLVRLTTVVSTDNYPTWSPDGTKIAFMSTRDGDEEIFAMNANGTNQTQITVNNRRDTYPTWSPDGTKIAFTSNLQAVNNLDIYRMNVDGSSVTRLTTKAKDDAIPAWSRNGLRIAFQGIDTDSDWEIYRVPATGGVLTKITNNTRTDVAPGW